MRKECAAALLFIACGVCPAAQGVAGRADVAQAWLSTADAAQKLAPLPAIPITGTASAALRIRVDPARRYQAIEGFGASFTDSSAWLIHQRMNAAQRAALLRELFDTRTGLGLGVTRVPLAASDFSLEHYSFDDVPAGETDEPLAHFSIAKARADVLPVVREARRVNPALRIFVSPWSAPAWMKTSGSLVTGKLEPRFYDAYARYFDRTLRAFAAEGAPVYALTIQNEPHFEPPTYPGMRMSPGERAAFIGRHLGPLLAQRWPKVRILDWDHNWDQPESPLGVLGDAQARKYLAGVAWHCYGGDVSAQSAVHEKYPELETWMTECSGGGWAPEWGGSLAWMTQNLVIGNLRNWGRGTILWNLALDEHSNPHLGGCGDCRGVVTIARDTGAVTRNVEYYVLGHASRFLKPGAQRIESDTGVEGLHTVAVRNPDGSLAMIVLNAANERRAFSVVTGSQAFAAALDPGSVATYTWNAAQPAAPEGAPLRLMTYNIRLDLASDGVNRWDNRRDWVAAQVEWLRPDIFGMQEVLPGQKADLAAALPHYQLYGGGRDDGGDKGEASPLGFDTRRFGMLEGGMFWLSPTPEVPSKGWDAAYPRVVTWARLRDRLTRRVLLALSTHWDHVGLVARRESAAQITRWVAAHAQRCEPVLILGDFNSAIGSEPMRDLTRGPPALRDARAVSKTPPFGPTGTFNTFQTAPTQPDAIDHILLGEGLEAERYAVITQVIDGRVPSDHFPVLVDASVAKCR